MFSPLTALLAVLIYMGLLFGLAQWVEHRITTGRSRFSSAWAYALSQTVLYTSWTFYGSVGFAVDNGLQFFGIYVGSMLGMMLTPIVLTRLVRAKEAFRITSLADFIATRYNHSQAIAALVTLFAFVGLLPYIALQLKAVVGALAVISAHPEQHDWNLAGSLVTLLMIMFTIVFGVRRLDPTERHQGMIAALVAECIFKLVAFLALGLFVTYVLFAGPGDLLNQMREQNLMHLVSFGDGHQDGTEWLTLIALGLTAAYCLPRQFHVGVVENSNPAHIRLIAWTFPLYTVLISLFVVPVTAAGLLLGLPAAQGDQFMLLVPQLANSQVMTLLAFLGGFAAATGMLLITTMTLATMASNHLVLPLSRMNRAMEGVSTHLLQVRWIMVALILGAGYAVARILDDSYILVAIGLISFAAVLQFAPALLIGIYWRRGNSMGALWGILAGFSVWAYTLVLPAWVHEGWLSPSWLSEGPFGIYWLRPEHLFGLDGLPPLTHSVVWSLSLNLSLYLIISLLYSPQKSERTLAREMLAWMRGTAPKHRAAATGLNAYIELPPKLEEARNVLGKYLHPAKLKTAVDQIVDDLQLNEKPRITIIELMELHRMLEHLLAGSIGAAAAHRVINDGIRYSEQESTDLKALYSHLLSELGPQLDSDGPAPAPDREAGYDLLMELQQSNERLQRLNQEQLQRLERLEQRIEQEYQRNFKLRIQAQHLKSENDLLRQRLVAEEGSSG